MLPCLIFEDEHLLAVNKPAGLNPHAPAPFAGEGLYEWLRHREPRWASLALIHRLDKETSGVMLFAKSRLANRSLTEQFAQRRVRKKYWLLTDRAVSQARFTVISALVRAGERYVSRPLHAGAESAETRFSKASDLQLRTPGFESSSLIEAWPLTGRTHQVRVHAAEKGFPVLGDTLYGGTPAPRVFLHAAELTVRHPATGVEMTFCAPAEFRTDPRLAMRRALIDPDETTAFRLIHGAADAWPGWSVDRLGGLLLSQAEHSLSDEQRECLETLRTASEPSLKLLLPSGLAAYHKQAHRRGRRTLAAAVSTQLLLGEAVSDRFTIRENGVQIELGLNEGASTGLFLDQRDNRRRFLTGHVAAGFSLLASAPRTPGPPVHVLNAFAYTCGFSVCAGLAGARTTSLDLSKKCLEWGRRNFALNGLDLAPHDFLFGDAFDWLRRLARKGRAFEAIALDPPTFSQSKEHGVFRAEQDYGRLVAAALPLLKPNGVLFASTNAAAFKPEDFLQTVEAAVHGVRRRIVQQHYVPQPPDFPITRAEPAYLKTVWMRLE